MGAQQGPPQVRTATSGAQASEDEEPARFADPEDSDPRRLADLARMVEMEIIPRLMLAHRTVPVVVGAGVDRPITAEDVAGFARLVLLEGDEAALAAMSAFRSSQVPVERLLLDLVAPTARHLGELWEQDLCGFTEVTVATGRLQRMMHELAPALGYASRRPAAPRRILLLPCPGEQHTLGVTMLHTFFLRAGWDVCGGAWAEGSEAPSWAASEWFDVVGFSLGSEIRLGALTDVITRLRLASRNRELVILVGGAVFAAQPEQVSKVGANGTASDVREAPAVAESLIQSVAKVKVSNG